MAYQHNQHQILFASGMTATASGDKAYWTPGYMPHIVRACGIVVTTSGSTTSGAVFAFKTQSLTSGAAAAVDLAVLTLTSGGTSGFALPTAALTAGQVMYKDGLTTKVSPGTKVTLNVRTAVTGTFGFRAFMWVEPSWELAGNTAGMYVTT